MPLVYLTFKVAGLIKSENMKTNLIKRRDYNRVLITETLPFETPIIFSNDGLYDLLSTIDTADEVLKVFICAPEFDTKRDKLLIYIGRA